MLALVQARLVRKLLAEAHGVETKTVFDLMSSTLFDAPAYQGRVRELVQAYNGRFGQHGVFWSEHPVCAGI